MSEKIIPPAPETLVLAEKAAHNLKLWIEYFKGLSRRVKLYTPDYPRFEDILDFCRKEVIDFHGIDPEYYKLETWPDPEDVAFIIYIDSSRQDQMQRFDQEDKFIFTFGDVAFGLNNYFSLEGEPDDHDRDTYSTREMSRRALSWEYIGRTIIPDRIRDAEDVVPDFPR